MEDIGGLAEPGLKGGGVGGAKGRPAQRRSQGWREARARLGEEGTLTGRFGGGAEEKPQTEERLKRDRRRRARKLSREEGAQRWPLWGGAGRRRDPKGDGVREGTGGGRGLEMGPKLVGGGRCPRDAEEKKWDGAPGPFPLKGTW